MLNDRYFGPLEFEVDATLNGMIVGDAIVPSGIEVLIAGMVTGNLIVKNDGAAIVYGKINGSIINEGGLVKVFGMVRDVQDKGSTRSHIDENAVVTG